MSENAKKTTKNVKPIAELIAEFGRISLLRIADSAIPSDANLAKLEEVGKEIADTEDAISKLDGVAKKYATQALDGMKFRQAVLRANMANPANLSATDVRMLQVAAKRILRAERANIVTLAQFVKDNAEVFPVKGTRY